MHVNKNTKDAFVWICKILSNENIDFSISGGFAAKIYGSPRHLYDIDIDLGDEDFHKVATLSSISPYIIFGPTRSIGKDWNIWLLTLSYKQQYIDICGSSSAKIYSHREKKWVPYPFNLKLSLPRRLFGINIKLISKDLLVEYKSHLNRKEDLEDLKYLSSQIK